MKAPRLRSTGTSGSAPASVKPDFAEVDEEINAQVKGICAIEQSEGPRGLLRNDLHDLALLILKLSDAHSASKSPNIRSRPTLNGLVKEFASLIDACNPDYGPVFAVIEKQGLSLGATVEFDDILRGRRMAPKDRVLMLPPSKVDPGGIPNVLA